MKRALLSAIMLVAGLSLYAQVRKDTTMTDRIMETTISARANRTTVRQGAVVTTIAGSPYEKAGTAEDVLGRIPGLSRKGDRIEVIGRGKPEIYIDSRKVHDPNELKRLNSDEIRQVEVISNPGAQYGAEVRAVVRIKTIKRKGEGLSLDLMARDQQMLTRCANDPNATLGINYRKGKSDVFFNTNYWSGHNYNDSQIEQTTTVPGMVLFQQGTLDSYWIGQGLNFDLGSSYQIDEASSVGARFYYTHTLSSTNFSDTSMDIFENGTLTDRLSTTNTTSADGNPWTGRLNTYFNGRIGKTGIDINADWFRSSTHSLGHVEENGSSSIDRVLDMSSSSSNSLWAVKAVAARAIWQGKLEYGGEYSSIDREEYYNIVPHILNTSQDKVEERAAAAFTQYSIPLLGGDLTGSLRYEHISYRHLGNDDAELTRSSDRLFPAISYNAKIKDTGISLSYTNKIRRPNFDQMSDAVSYYNRYTLQTGTPTLSNMTEHTLNLIATRKWFTFNCLYEHFDESLVQWAELYGDEGCVVLNWKNLEQPQRILTLTLVAQPTIGCWHPAWTAGFRKPWLDLGWASFNRPMVFGFINNSFLFRNKWQFNADLAARNPMDEGTVSILNGYCNITLSVQKSFLEDDALTIGFRVHDILDMTNETVAFDMGVYKLWQDQYYFSPRAEVTLRYKFNSTASKYRGSGAGNDTRNRL